MRQSKVKTEQHETLAAELARAEETRAAEERREAAAPGKTDAKAEPDADELRAVETVSASLPEIAEAMVSQAIGGSTTAAKVCLDILNRTPTPMKTRLEEVRLARERQGLREETGTVFVLTSLAGVRGKKRTRAKGGEPPSENE